MSKKPRQMTDRPRTTGTATEWKVQQTVFQKPKQPKPAPTTSGGGNTGGEKEILHQKPLLGTVNSWRGKFGFITPDDTIEHPMANRHSGDLYFDQTDVQREIKGVGARVRFVLYSDRKGLGAMKVRPA